VTETGLIGAAGEYLVAAELSRRGWLATVTVKNAPATDVLAQHVASGHVVAIQSKTTTSADRWVLGVKSESPTQKLNEWVVLVRLRRHDERPEFWICPRNHVAALLWVQHRAWLAEPGRGGRKHQDNPMRNIRSDAVAAYKEQWEWLLRPTSRIQYQFSDWFTEHVPRFGLPNGHPDRRKFGLSD
jgi:hypothetical protein